MTTAMEALVSIKETEANGGRLVTPTRLSEQHLLDCGKRGAANVAKDYGNYGCGGGWIDKYSDLVKNEGVVEYDSYRAYENKDGLCEHNADDVVTNSVADGQILTSIQDAILQLQMGPMPISLTQGDIGFFFYRKGIYSDEDCPTGEYHNHAMVIVGYGVETTTVVVTEGTESTTCRKAKREEKKKKSCKYGGTFSGKDKCCTTVTTPEEVESTEEPYFLLQNSWGTGWGEDGFMRMAITGGRGVCGINRNLRWLSL